MLSMSHLQQSLVQGAVYTKPIIRLKWLFLLQYFVQAVFIPNLLHAFKLTDWNKLSFMQGFVYTKSVKQIQNITFASLKKNQGYAPKTKSVTRLLRLFWTHCLSFKAIAYTFFYKLDIYHGDQLWSCHGAIIRKRKYKHFEMTLFSFSCYASISQTTIVII